MRSRLLRWFQYGLAVAVFAFAAQQVQWLQVLTLLSGIGAGLVLVVLVLTLLEYGTMFSTWWVLFHGLQSISLRTSATIDLVVKFINHLLPSKASGQSVAPLVIRHYTDSTWSEAVAIVGLNSSLYAVFYGGVALLGLALFAAGLSRGLFIVLLLSGLTYAVVGLLILLAGRRMALFGRFHRLGGLLDRVPRIGSTLAGFVELLPDFTEETGRVFRAVSGKPTIMVAYFLCWVGMRMLFPGARVWLLLVGLGAGFQNPLLIPVVLVLAYSVTVLPITPGGIGIAEASATLVFVSLGISEEIAIAVVIIDRTLGAYLPALLGWFPVLSLDLEQLLEDHT